jgi:tRNA-2-methylthio-N6-dimethylallyladenosine synthase
MNDKEVTKEKVFIRTFGCQMNVRDSEVICGLLKEEGYKIADDTQDADIVLFNTCSVRQHAEERVWSEIGRYKNKKIIGVVGCMASNYKEKIFERAPNVSLVVGPQDIHKIPEIIKVLTEDKVLFERKIWETDGELRPAEIYHTGFYQDKEHAYVVISEGCSNYCSYCVVPYVRSALRNRNYKDILKEIEEALDRGITKITLLGQNVNAYQDTGHKPQATSSPKPAACSLQPQTLNFVKLLEMVNKIMGLKEFSFITSHPKDTSLDLFKVMADSGKLKKYLHLPVQSGSDKILRLMNRGYTKKFYLDLVHNYRKMVKDGVLTTDIIVGFPTENEEDFQETYDLVKKIECDAAYIFKYSPRPHTEAVKFVDDISRAEKERRHRLILELQKEISKKKSVKSK